MQRRDGDFTPTDTPGRIAIVDRVHALGAYATVRDVVMAGGIRRLTVEEMFSGR